MDVKWHCRRCIPKPLTIKQPHSGYEQLFFETCGQAPPPKEKCPPSGINIQNSISSFQIYEKRTDSAWYLWTTLVSRLMTFNVTPYDVTKKYSHYLYWRPLLHMGWQYTARITVNFFIFREDSVAQHKNVKIYFCLTYFKNKLFTTVHKLLTNVTFLVNR